MLVVNDILKREPQNQKAPNIGSTCFFEEMGLAVHRRECPGQITTYQVKTKEL